MHLTLAMPPSFGRLSQSQLIYIYLNFTFIFCVSIIFGPKYINLDFPFDYKNIRHFSRPEIAGAMNNFVSFL